MPSALFGVTVLGWDDQLAEIEAIAVRALKGTSRAGFTNVILSNHARSYRSWSTHSFSRSREFDGGRALV